ncbi:MULTISPECIES: cytochrome-c oxidase, cbb3-type subunit III [Delftia]|mgnify:FL=1|jgi:cytochrome c oxidase cbb3-type subunit 3|uniref:Cbb3-type cytochrome c oxidase subunit n=3 Tax=Pseudomonadota TaxID=1224 RepID=A0AAX3STG8_9BURK|nr:MULTISPECIES: cytochrome-c oxidase, cbb3-type subunit III [Delftia]KAA9172062.1 cytochrome-c oxidase, cbb3-type subunit III [Delftia sp. BR1]AOV01622.1 cytochrome-c oxidase, cbb3-type subunit III [Delftia tsuruhatensis]EPD41001.1 cytochrome c oxidase, cbb3-type, subunit III [Delftia acidovorans CCUG 15835]EPD44661.1 cytochrome c oxidase, cbb3-type, subunit III [Delftia acidovorans CCUG 274B]KLO58338.1 cytochrome oxidase subunit III [Delftia tsuruhatensis]
MSDFVNNFWSIYVTAITLGGIIGCLLLLYLTARKKVVPSADNTTGHVWDEDLRELNNPMPKWWMWLFIITSVFGFAYLAAYPGLGSFAGKLGWTQLGAYENEMAKARADLEPLYAKFTSMSTEDMAKDPQAMAIGERLFMNNCAQCHGSDARGGKSFPNLTDGDWLHGGTPDKIRETITAGRIGIMPPMAAAVGTPDDVRNLSHYVLSLSGSPHDSLKASLGKSKFTACAACHGMDGKGNQALGAPNLTDDIWLHGWGEAAITAMINNGKHNEMPAQKDKLTEAQIAVLASYVWGMSHKDGAVRQ